MNSASTLTIAPLRSDLCITPQTDGASGKVMVSHPGTGRVFLFPQRSFQILAGLRHNESLEDVFTRATGTAHPPDPVRNALISLLQQTWSAGLLEGIDGAPSPRGWKRWNPFFFRVPLGNPEKALDFLSPVARFLFSFPALLLWLAGIATATLLLHAQRIEYLQSFPAFGRFAAWPLFYFLWAASACLHELGHALACKRFGIRVREMGLLFYLFYPGAYADVSAAWTLSSRRQRIVISLGGLYVDSLLWVAAIFCWGWLGTETGLGQATFIFSAVLLPRIAMNIIPFLRLDGYWVLSDLLRIPNLRPHAYAYLWSLVCPARWNRSAVSRRVRKDATVTQVCVFVTYGLMALCCTLIMGFCGLVGMLQLVSITASSVAAASHSFFK